MTTAPTIAVAALDYHARGWKPVPVSRKTKKPIGTGWQKRPFDPAQFNGNAQNIAIQLGAVSGGLVDVDLDSTLAIGLAPEFLPTTGAIFGHRSKPCSHQLYLSDLYRTEKAATIAYKYKDGREILSLRIGADGKGATSVVPPSMHITGEMVQWDSEGEPACVAGTDLKRACLKLAVTCLLVPHYQGQGSRHEAALALGGVLARAGWKIEDIEQLVEVLARTCRDDDVRDRVVAATSAVNAKANGHDVANFPRLAELWGKDAADTLGKWIGVREHRGQNKGAGLEDEVALEFAGQHAKDFRFVAESNLWLRWTGTHWQPEKTALAFDMSRTLCRKAGEAKARTVAGVLTLARSDRRLAAAVDQWDRDRMLLTAGKSTVDLRTGLDRAPNRLDYITKIAATAIADQGTPHPFWTSFLDKVTDADETLIGFLQRFAGYCLTGETSEHAFLFLYGPGRNGKGVFVNTLAKIMGQYAITAPMEMFLASNHDRHPTEIARLKGARLVTSQETQKGRRWDEAKLKALTSSDPLSGHFMRQDFFDFDPTHKLIITGNHKPSLISGDVAIRHRLLLVPFTVEIPAEERDPNFADKLVPEHPAILRWMVDGCLEWERDGLMVPDRVRKASDEYFAGQDSLEQWIEDWIDDSDPNVFTPTKELFPSWKMWAEQRNMKSGIEMTFAESLADKGYKRHRTTSARGFKGIKLKPHDGPSHV